MAPAEFELRLRKLALREGMTFATLTALPPADAEVVRASLLALFAPDAVCNERTVNARLQSWLAGAGGMVETDHAHLRRWLVDTQVLARTADCAEYRVAPGMAAAWPSALVGIDAARIVAEARGERDAQRAARKAAWAGNPQGAA